MAVLISIKPNWCYLIAERLKTIEIRKNKPHILAPFKCYIYETCAETSTPWMDEDGHLIFRGRGMVIGEFICDWCDPFHVWRKEEIAELVLGSYLDPIGIRDYAGKKEVLYGWHISELKIYDEPRPLTDFRTKPCDFAASCGACVHSRWSEQDYHKFIGCSFDVKRPPQSWMYVEELAT